MSGLAWESAERREVEHCRIACESAAVMVSSFRTGNGLRLKLTSERTGEQVLLDATVLEALCHLSPERGAEIVRERTEART